MNTTRALNNVMNTIDLTTEVVLSQEMTAIFQWVLYACVCQLIDVFGTVTNIVNIICFIKQGFKDPINISLLGLAVSDLGCLTTLIWTNLSFTPAFYQADLPFSAPDVQYLASAWPHVAFTRITCWITALITLERCLCIVAPLKIKTIITPRRTFVAIVSLYVILIFSLSPVYVVNRLDMKYFPSINKSIIGLVFTENRNKVERISFSVNNVFIPSLAVTIIICCTLSLVIVLKRKTQWREKSVSSSQAEHVSGRNRKVSKMVVMISSIFILCFAPTSVIFLATAFVPGLSMEGKHINVVIVLVGCVFILESVNSSTNIFIYYYMSSKYRVAFDQMFRKINKK